MQKYKLMVIILFLNSFSNHNVLKLILNIFIVNPISGHIVSNGYPGQLQMIDITTLPINTSSDSLKPSYHSSSFVLDSIQVK